MGSIIGIDIGGTYFRMGLVDPAGEVTRFRKRPVGEVFSGRDPLGELCACLDEFCPREDVEAIAIGFPATLDARRETVLQAPNVPFMENLPVAAELSRWWRVPVFLERDVTMALYWDCREYRVPPRGIVCGFYFGTGVGNAISIDGFPLIGKNGTAGELGHIPVDGSEAPCGCGNVGCLETLAGGKYLARLREERWRECPMGELFLRYGQTPELRRFVDRMAMAVATEVNILDPHTVLVGGGVPAMAGFPRDYFRERILLHTRKPFPAQSLEILFTEDSEDKCVRGASLYARSRLQMP